MAFVAFTRPDDTVVMINSIEILHFAPVPPSGPLAGPLKKGTRIVYKNNNGHQDVKELVDEVARRLNSA